MGGELSPEACNARWYELPDWIAQGFRRTQWGERQWQRTRMTDPTTASADVGGGGNVVAAEHSWEADAATEHQKSLPIYSSSRRRESYLASVPQRPLVHPFSAISATPRRCSGHCQPLSDGRVRSSLAAQRSSTIISLQRRDQSNQECRARSGVRSIETAAAYRSGLPLDDPD